VVIENWFAAAHRLIICHIFQNTVTSRLERLISSSWILFGNTSSAWQVCWLHSEWGYQLLSATEYEVKKCIPFLVEAF